MPGHYDRAVEEPPRNQGRWPWPDAVPDHGLIAIEGSPKSDALKKIRKPKRMVNRTKAGERK